MTDPTHPEYSCCRKLQEAFHKNPERKLVKAYAKWAETNEAIAECDAYKESIRCARDEGGRYDCCNFFKGKAPKPDIQTMKPKGYLQSKYCWALYDYYKQAMTHKIQYCQSAKPYTPCPDFDNL